MNKLDGSLRKESATSEWASPVQRANKHTPGQTPHSSMLPPKLVRGPHPELLLARSSFLMYVGTLEPLPGGGPSNHVHHLPPSLSEPLPALPLPFLFDRERERALSAADRALSFGPVSGSSANETRFGVLRPEPMPTASEMLNQELLSESVGETGVGGAERPLRPFIADTRGGEGGRVDDECRGFVKRRETLAVAFDDPATGVTLGGLRNAGRGGVLGGSGAGGGLFCRMMRREVRVRSTCRSSEDDELDAEGSSMMGGVSHVRRAERHGEWLGEREARAGDERALRVTVVVVEVLLLPDRGRVRNDEDGETVRELEFDLDDPAVRCGTYVARRSMADFDGSALSDSAPRKSSGRRLLSVGSEAATARLDERSPSVAGRTMVSGSAAVSTYIVIARGVGAMRSFRS